MFEVTFTVFFDNGHDYYDLEMTALINDDAELTTGDIVALTEQFNRNDYVGGECIGFQIADSEWDLQEEQGNAVYDEERCEMYVTNPDFKWLEISCGKDDIEKAFEREKEV